MILVPAGTWRFDCAIAVENKDVAVIGVGAGLSKLMFTGEKPGAAGIRVTQTSNQRQVYIAHLSLFTNAAQTAGNAAIRIVYPTVTPGPGPKQVRIENVEIGVSNSPTTYWAYGIDCESCSGTYLSDIVIHGRNEANASTGISAANMAAGVRLTGYSLAVALQSVNVTFARDGYYFSGDSEGAAIHGAQLVAVNTCIMLDDKAHSSDPASIIGPPGPYLLGTHCASYERALLSRGWKQTVWAASSFYKRPESVADYVAFDLRVGAVGGITTGTNENLFANNQIFGFLGSAPGAAVALRTDAVSDGNTFTGNAVRFLNHAYDGSNGATTNYVFANTATGLQGAWTTRVAGNRSVVRENWPLAGTGQLAANSQMTMTPLPPGPRPEIGASNLKTFYTANESRTKVARLVNCGPGETYRIVGNDGGRTTLQHNPGLVLMAGVDLTLADGRSVTLECFGTGLREVGRSVW